MNGNRTLWIVLVILLLVICCCCCALTWAAGGAVLGGVRSWNLSGASEKGNWETWLRSWDEGWRGWAGPWATGPESQASATINKSLAVSGPAALDLNVPVGDIVVKAGAAEQVKIEGAVRAYAVSQAEAQRTLDNIQVKIDQSGDKVWVRVSGMPTTSVGRSPQIDLTITAPKQTTLSAEMGVGRLQVSGTEGDVTINAQVGDVILTDIVPAEKLAVKTRVSNVEFAGVLVAKARYEITTDMGRIALRVPADSAFQIDARSDIGDVKVDFQIVGRSSRDALVGKEVQGQIGQNPTVSLYLRSRVGAISVTPGR